MKHLGEGFFLYYFRKELSEKGLKNFRVHINNCKVCSQKLENFQLLAVTTKIISKESAFKLKEDCLSKGQLIDIYLGRNKDRSLKSHLLECSHCFQELIMLAKSDLNFKEDPVIDSIPERLYKFISFYKRELQFEIAEEWNRWEQVKREATAEQFIEKTINLFFPVLII